MAIVAGGVVLNIADDESVRAAIKDINDNDGAPTILVNNAGITRDNLLMRMKQDEWDDVLSTNLSGMYRVCKACLRGMMKAKKGRIVNIASVIGVTGNAGQANYAAAKAGMIRLLQIARQGDRQPQHYRQRGRTGLHRHGHDTGAAGRPESRNAGPDSARSAG